MSGRPGVDFTFQAPRFDAAVAKPVVCEQEGTPYVGRELLGDARIQASLFELATESPGITIRADACADDDALHIVSPLMYRRLLEGTAGATGTANRLATSVRQALGGQVLRVAVDRVNRTADIHGPNSIVRVGLLNPTRASHLADQVHITEQLPTELARSNRPQRPSVSIAEIAPIADDEDIRRLLGLTRALFRMQPELGEPAVFFAPPKV